MPKVWRTPKPKSIISILSTSLGVRTILALSNILMVFSLALASFSRESIVSTPIYHLNNSLVLCNFPHYRNNFLPHLGPDPRRISAHSAGFAQKYMQILGIDREEPSRGSL